MKVKDFIKLEIDVDVYDNVTEELGIAFVGAVELTEEGKEQFEDVLEYNIELDFDNQCAIVDVDGEGNTWKKKLRKASKFFYALAGYCDCNDYEKWFKES